MHTAKDMETANNNAKNKQTNLANDAKSNEQTHIDKLHKAYDNDERATLSLANLLNSIINSSLSGSLKFLFELIQNADDAENKDSSEPITLDFILVKDYFVIRHNGKHFDENDVEKIADVAALPKQDKSSDATKTGYKGIGFKALFSIADYVAVFSNGYHFRFEKNVWKKSAERPWQIIPIWTEKADIPVDAKPHIQDGLVNIILRLNPNAKLQNEFEFVQSNPQVMLFLRRVKKINLNNNGKQVTIEYTTQSVPTTPFSISQFRVNDTIASEWLCYTTECEIPKDIKAQLQSLDETVCPKRIKDAPNTKITYTASFSGKKLTACKDTVLYATLPSQELCGLPFIVNGEFLLSPDRTRLNENVWNRFLLNKIAQKQFGWLRQLAEYPVTRSVLLNVLSSPVIAIYSDVLKAAFAKGYQTGCLEIAWIPSASQSIKYLNAKKCIVDSTEFYQRFNVTDSIVNQFVAYDLVSVDRLIELEFAGKFTFRQLLPRLKDYLLASQEADFNYRLITFLHEVFRKERGQLEGIEKLAFLQVENGEVVTPQQAYLPTKDHTEIPQVFSISLVKQSAIQSQKSLIAWLKELGANEADRIHIIKTKVFRLIKDDKINPQNSIVILRYVFLAAQQAELTKDDYEILENYKLLTKSGQMKLPRECYLADCYNPTLSLENHIKKPNLYIVDYSEKEADRPAWVQFLIRLGVTEAIQVRTISWHVREVALKDEYMKDYFAYIKHKNNCPENNMGAVGKHKIKNFVDINFMGLLVDRASNPFYAPIFWRLIVHNWVLIKRCADDSTYHSSKSPKLIISYIPYFMATKKCILASDGNLYPATQLYAPQLQELTKGVLLTATIPEAINDEQAKWLGFKINLSLSDILKLLDLMKANPERAKSINYMILFEQILQLATHEQEIIKSYKNNIYLLAENNTLQPVAKLFYHESEQFKAPPDSAQYFKLLPGFTHQQMRKLCHIFDIQLITTEKLQLIYDEPIEEDHIQCFIKKLLPFIAIQEAHARKEDINLVLEELLALLQQMKCYSVKRLAIKSAYGQDGVEKLFYRDNTTFYYTGRWNKSTAKLHIFEELARYLNVKTDVREIFRLKTDLGINDWLKANRVSKDKYYELQATVKEMSSPSLSKADSIMDNSLSSQDDSLDSSTSGLESPLNKLLIDIAKKDALVLEKNIPTPAQSPAPTIGEILESNPNKNTGTNNPPPKLVTVDGIPLSPISSNTVSDTQSTPSPDGTESFIKSKLKKSASSTTEDNQTPQFQPEVLPQNASLSKFSFFKPDLKSVTPSPTTTAKSGHLKAGSGGMKTKNQLSDKDKLKIGLWSEEYVYFKILRDRYLGKYSEGGKPATIEDTKDGFILKGQKLNKNTQELTPVTVEVLWFNKSGEQYKPIDFKINRNGKEKYIEVKGTKSNDKRSFEISANEVAFMKEIKDRYRIYRLFNAGKDKDVRVEKIKNPAGEIDKTLIIEPAIYKLKYGVKNT